MTTKLFSKLARLNANKSVLARYIGDLVNWWFVISRFQCTSNLVYSITKRFLTKKIKVKHAHSSAFLLNHKGRFQTEDRCIPLVLGYARNF